MTENYITRIFVKQSRNVKDFDISLSTSHRQHLIITGKNGSGKTSLLLEINKFLSQFIDGQFAQVELMASNYNKLKIQFVQGDDSEDQNINLANEIKIYEDWFNQFGGTDIEFSGTKNALFQKVQNGSFVIAFFDSKRHAKLNVPKGVNKIELKKKYNLRDNVNQNFLQYIVNLKADRSFARDDNELNTVRKIDNWFYRFEERLKLIFDASDLELRFNRKTYNFDIIVNKGEPFSFNTLSDGYSAIISILTELILRMEAHEVKNYDLEGVVIVDEIETHLHVDLQKIILPFLADFFPKIQFIVTTHSPFVLSSLSNATICDLETKIVTTDLSAYSYDALIESYFKTDKYSTEVKNLISEFDTLISKENLTNEENERVRYLKNYFAHAPKYLSNELLVKLQQIELLELINKKNN